MQGVGLELTRPGELVSPRGFWLDDGYRTTRSNTTYRDAVLVTRTVLLMVLILIVGGGAAIYVWSSLNLLVKGQAPLFQGVTTVLAIAGIIGMLLPWSLGIWEHTDPQLRRTRFWLTGHAIV